MKTIFLTAILLGLVFVSCQDSSMEPNLDTLEKSGPKEQVKPIKEQGPTMYFFGNPIQNNQFIENCFSEERHLLERGQFEGTLQGYGKIKSDLSFYEFISCETKDSYPDNWPEYIMYAVEARGMIYISPRDYCTVTIFGQIYPGIDERSGLHIGVFDGIAYLQDGVGKLENINKTFKVINHRYSVNLTTGEMGLLFRT